MIFLWTAHISITNPLHRTRHDINWAEDVKGAVKGPPFVLCRGNSKSEQVERAKADNAWSEQKRTGGIREVVGRQRFAEMVMEKGEPPRGLAPVERAKADKTGMWRMIAT